jgi:predicted HicB family RNase H-like nuclease
MVVEKLDKEKITVSFSGAVGRKGLISIKKYIEFLEANGIPKKKEVSVRLIKELSDEVNKAAAEKFKKAKGY